MRMIFIKSQPVYLSVLLFVSLSFVLSTPQIVNAQALHDCLNFGPGWRLLKTEKKKTPSYWIDPSFSASEQKFIREALAKAVQRIQDKAVWQEVRGSYRFAHPKAKTISSSGYCNNLNVKRNLLFHQLNFLTSSKTSPFPKIFIYRRNIAPKKGLPGWLGYAYYDRVSVYWDYSLQRFRHSGNFQLYLNQHFLRRGGIYKSSDFWAGTIAHEMLHNLGHQHPNAKDRRYRSFQINVLADAIRSFGRGPTAGDVEYPVHTCRLKSSGMETAGHIE